MMMKQKISISSPLVYVFIICLIYLKPNLIIIKYAEGYNNSFLQLTSKKTFDITDFGAIGDGLTDDSLIFKHVWSLACSLSSKATIEFPAGKIFLLHPISFGGPCQGKLTLKISGEIIAPEDPDLWVCLDPLKWLYFHGVNHLTIEGRGVIDGMGYEWWARSCKTNDTNPCHHAPRALTFHRCNKLKVKDIAIVNAQQMHLAFTNCSNVEASNLKVLAPEYSPNTDGVHISSSYDVEIEDSIIKTGDDCISIVGNSSKIKIKNIYCGPGHGISIGSLGKSNSSVNVHDVKVDEAFFSNTENGVRIKTWQGGDGYASKISFKNIWMDNVSNPIIIDQYYCDSLTPCDNQTMAVKIEDISFIGIKGTSATEEAITFACSDAYPCEKIYIEDVQLVSSSRGYPVTSYCWQSQGTFSGFVHPSSCLSNNRSCIEQKPHSSYVSHSM